MKLPGSDGYPMIKHLLQDLKFVEYLYSKILLLSGHFFPFLILWVLYCIFQKFHTKQTREP